MEFSDQDGENTLCKLRRAQPGIKILAMTGRFPAVSTNPPFVRRRPRFPIMEIAVLKARIFLSADETLPKPVSADLLIATTKKLLGNSASGCRCAESETIRESVLKAAEQVVAAALSFQSNVALAKNEDAALSFSAMRVAVIKCDAASSLWSRHPAEHGC
jgi:hypothetical protein